MAGGVSIGPKIGIDGESEYRKSIQNIIEQGKLLQLQMENVGKGFDEATTDTEKYEATSEQLGKQIENQKKLISELADMVQRSAQVKGEDSTETVKWSQQLEKAKSGLADMEQNLSETTKSFEQSQKASDDLGGSLSAVADDVGELSETEEELAENTDKAQKKSKLFGDVLKAELLSKLIIDGVKNLAEGFKKVGEAITGAFTDSVKWADELNTLSEKTGVSTEKLQEWEYMSSLLDVDINTLTASNTKLIKTMASAQSGSASASEAFKQLGVAYQNTDGSLRASDEVMFEVINALGGVGNEAERDALAMQIFGKSAMELNPLIKAGADQINALAQEAHDVGYVLDSDAVGALNRTQDAMDRMKNAGDGLKRQMSAEFAPVIADAFEAVIPVVNKFGKTIADVFKGNKDVSVFVDEVMSSIETLITNFEKNAPQFLKQGEQLLKSLIEGIQRTVPKLLDLVVPMLSRLAQTIISNLGTILDSGIKIINTIINGISKALPELIAQFPTIIKTIVSTLHNNLPAMIDAGINLILALIKGIIEMGFNLGKVIFDLGQSIVNEFKGLSLADIGKKLIQGLWDGIQNMRKWIGEKVGGFCKDLLNSFKRMFGIHSPSKVFADQIGSNLALGIGEGFDSEMGAVARSMTDAIPMSFGMSGSGSYRQTNLGGVNITVNGAEGQNVQELADEIMFRMQTAVSRREMVFA